MDSKPARRWRKNERGPLRVLLVEDEELVRFMTVRQLRRLGCEVVSALDSHDALESFFVGDPDVVLLDLHGEELDGCETAARIRALERGAGESRRRIILAYTASSDPQDEGRCRAAGMDGILHKPFTAERFRHALELGGLGTQALILPATSQAAVPPPAKVSSAKPGGGEGSEELGLLDEGRLKEMRDDLGEDRYQAMLAAALRSLNRCLERLATAAAEGDAEAVRAAAHRLAGMAGLAGLPGLCRSAATLEAMAPTLSSDSLAAAAVGCLELGRRCHDSLAERR